MAKTPLELYRQGFELQGRRQLEEAAVLYKEIIKQFPNANESAYAAIQLEKIMAGDVAEQTGKRPNLVGWFFGFVVLLLLMALGGMEYFAYDRLSRRLSDLERESRVISRTLRQTQRELSALSEQTSSLTTSSGRRR